MNLALGRQGDVRTVDRLVEVNLEFDLVISSPTGPRGRLRSSPSAKELAEEVSEIRGTAPSFFGFTKIKSESTGILPRRARLTKRVKTGIRSAVNMTESIELLPLFLVRENGVGFLDLLESLLRLGVIGVDVRVELPRQLPIRLLDIGSRRLAVHPESFVKV